MCIWFTSLLNNSGIVGKQCFRAQPGLNARSQVGRSALSGCPFCPGRFPAKRRKRTVNKAFIIQIRTLSSSKGRTDLLLL